MPTLRLKWIQWLVLSGMTLQLSSCESNAPLSDSTQIPQADTVPNSGEDVPENEEESQTHWSYLDFRYESDYRAPEECGFPRHFKLYEDGRFRAGPCEPPSGGVRTGKITLEERTELLSLVNAIMKNGPRDGAADCEDSGVMADARLGMGLFNGDVVNVYDESIDTELTCYRGGRDEVLTLLDYIGSLEERYYPKPALDP